MFIKLNPAFGWQFVKNEHEGNPRLPLIGTPPLNLNILYSFFFILFREIESKMSLKILQEDKQGNLHLNFDNGFYSLLKVLPVDYFL